ncbi:MAG: zinc ribbon domain-containing protein [Oscillibacter sp.]|nr:zinc ribbon domain-containing protein [Oscillibacter sp.]
MFCIKCGAKLPEDANFCPKCGAKVSREEASDSLPDNLPEFDFSDLFDNIDLSAFGGAEAGDNPGNERKAGDDLDNERNHDIEVNEGYYGDVLDFPWMPPSVSKEACVFHDNDTIYRVYRGKNGEIQGLAHQLREKEDGLESPCRVKQIEDGILVAAFSQKKNGDLCLSVAKYTNGLKFVWKKDLGKETPPGAESDVFIEGGRVLAFDTLWDEYSDKTTQKLRCYDNILGSGPVRASVKNIAGFRIVDPRKTVFFNGCFYTEIRSNKKRTTPDGDKEDDTFRAQINLSDFSVKRCFNTRTCYWDDKLFLDFKQGLAWTGFTSDEASQFEKRLPRDAFSPRDWLVPREIMGGKPRANCPCVHIEELGYMSEYAYFDGKTAYVADNYCTFYGVKPDGKLSKNWGEQINNGGHGESKRTMVWGDYLIADLDAYGFAIYPKAVEIPEGFQPVKLGEISKPVPFERYVEIE